jgi:SSS family transporter
MSALIDSLREHWLVHAMLFGYTLVMAYSAWVGNRQTEGMTDYYVGGRKMGGIVLGLSFFATYSSTNSFVGFSGKAYEWGIGWLLLIPFIVTMSLFAWMVVAPRLRFFAEELDSVTIPDFIGFRFDSTAARVLAAVLVVFASLFYMTAIFKGIGNLLETFLDLPYRTSIGLVFVIVVLYTMVGGFISVVKTDAIQGVVMAIAAVLLFTGTVGAAGGLGALSEIRNAPDTSHLFEWGGGVGIAVLLGTLFASTLKFAVEPRQLSRFYALEGKSALKKGALISTGTFAAVYLLLVPIGLYARKVIPEGLADTDLVVPTLLSDPAVFGPVTSAFLLVAMVAAAMSSLDSVLLVMASTVERDIVGVFRPPESDAAAVKATRVYVALFAAITALISLDPPGSIVSLTVLSGSLYGACFFPAVVVGLYWEGGDGRSAVTSFLVGVTTLIVWPMSPLSGALHQVFPALILSLAVFLLLGRKRRPNQEVQRLFLKLGSEESARAQ